jgi:D-alanine-D-alanine ligase
VRDVSDLLRMIDELQATYQSPVLVEEFIPGREFYVGVLGNQNAVALPVIELQFKDRTNNPHGIASFDVKWSETRDHETASIFPADVPKDLIERMQAIAVEAFHSLRLRDYARIDLRLSEAGEVFVIEVNPNCYLERNSEFARAAAQAGIAYEALVPQVAELANARYSR